MISSESASIPEPFGKYLLDREIARGGMARVHLARLRGLGGFEKRLVVKQILPHLAQDPRFVSMFVEEAKTLVQMSHPHIVPVYELGVVDGVYFLAMEYVEGATLADVLAEGVLEPAQAAHVGAQVCDALSYAHERFSVVHRDVTPRNVMVDAAGHCRLLDFGIAAPAEADAAGALFGTPGYLSPEQARGDAIGAAADLFSVGALLHHALVGEPPVRADELDALREERVRIESLRERGIDAELAAIVDRALAMDPADRPESARALARALRGWLAGHSPEGVSHEVGARAERARARRDRVRASQRPPPPLGSTVSLATGSVASEREGDAPRRDPTGSSRTLAQSRALEEIIEGTARIDRPSAPLLDPGTARIDRPAPPNLGQANPNLGQQPSPNLGQQPNPNLGQQPNPNLGQQPNPNLGQRDHIRERGQAAPTDLNLSQPPPANLNLGQPEHVLDNGQSTPAEPNLGRVEPNLGRSGHVHERGAVDPAKSNPSEPNLGRVEPNLGRSGHVHERGAVGPAESNPSEPNLGRVEPNLGRSEPAEASTGSPVGHAALVEARPAARPARRRWLVVLGAGIASLALAGLVALGTNEPPSAPPAAPAPVASPPRTSVPPTPPAEVPSPLPDPEPAPAAPETAPPTARASSQPPDPPRARTATLAVSSRDWAEIRLDGRALGTTPIRRATIAPGPHTIIAENAPLGLRATATFRAEPGERLRLVVDFRATPPRIDVER